MAELLLVMSKARSGADADYLNWYKSQHLGDVSRVPGVAGGRLYTLAKPDDAAQWTAAARYTLDAPATSVLPELFARAGSADMPMTDTIDGDSVLMLSASPIGPRVVANGVADRSDGLLFVVLTNSTPGDDDAFNSWYSDRHIPDVLDVPGFIAAQRFTLARETAGKISPWGYLSLYEVAPENPDETMDELGRRAGTDAMPLSPTLATEGVYATMFVPAA